MNGVKIFAGVLVGCTLAFVLSALLIPPHPSARQIREVEVSCINRDGFSYTLKFNGKQARYQAGEGSLSVHYTSEAGRPALFVLNYMPGEICTMEAYNAPLRN